MIRKSALTDFAGAGVAAFLASPGVFAAAGVAGLAGTALSFLALAGWTGSFLTDDAAVAFVFCCFAAGVDAAGEAAGAGLFLESACFAGGGCSSQVRIFTSTAHQNVCHYLVVLVLIVVVVIISIGHFVILILSQGVVNIYHLCSSVVFLYSLQCSML